MIAYLDTSFLLKNYVEEADSSSARRLWSDADVVFVSRISFAEAICSFERKRRMGELKPEDFRRAVDEFIHDWPTLEKIELNQALEPLVVDLASRHPLRALDAIQLASGVACARTAGADFWFASADLRLLTAAAAEGLHCWPAAV